MEPVRFDQMRRGCWDPTARVADMDLAGIWASVSFPSQITGFCGAVYSGCSDPELGKACVRAWNDWFAEEWREPYPDRFVGLGIVYLADPDEAAAEIRRNAARGFTAVSLPEQPHRLGYPSLHSGWWDPVLAACVETGTVVCLHVGSSGMMDMALDGPLVEIGATLFSSLSLAACVDWLWSGVALRFPDLRIAMSEGGIGWVPMLADRLDYIHDWSGHGRGAWPSTELTPTEVLLRNFWFCTRRRPVDLAHPRPHRRRPHHGRGRLPPRRLDLARHPALPHRAAGRAPASTSSGGSPTPTRPSCSATRSRRTCRP